MASSLSNRALTVFKSVATLGREPQSFLGAAWIPAFLRRLPKNKQRKWALRILALSPHYFLNREKPEFRNLPLDAYYEEEVKLGTASRNSIYENVLKPHLRADDVVIDYGCGPGFVSKAMSPHVKKLYSCDISTGALACAEIINSASNITYVKADEKGLSTIPDSSIDVVVSFAVIQHLSDEIFSLVLENCRQKLKPGGRIVFQIQLTDDVWKTEAEHRDDGSLENQIKLKYGLHCFGRTAEAHIEKLEEHGFDNIQITHIADANGNSFAGFSEGHLLTAILA